MFKRKLQALDFHNPNGFTASDETQYRNLVIWLEDQKIRHYKIEDRAGLRNICGGNWENIMKQYLSDLGYVGPTDKKAALLDWLLGYAVRLDYGDNIEKFKNAPTPGGNQASAPGQSANPLEAIDVNDPDFKAGVLSLAGILQLPPHADHTQVFKAVSILIQQRLNKAAVEQVQQVGIKPSNQIPMEKINLGFETGDYITAEASKILRMLHVKELRELQDSVNEAIVNVQALTANPKTDARLGKVGRM